MSDQNPPKDVTGTGRAYVWDLPTRIFHWGLVASVATSLTAGELGYMDVHLISGHVVLALILFRVVWGVLGGRHARFAEFVKGPRAVMDYAKGLMRGEAPSYLGHNPMGALSVLAILAVLATQVGTGLFANDDILTEGPLAKTISKSLSDTLTYYHELSGTVLYWLIGLHLAAVAFYTFKGERLIGAMITGVKTDAPDSTQENVRGNIAVAVIIAAVVAAVAYYVRTF